MKKQIVATILAVVTVLMCCAFTSEVKANENVEPMVKYVTQTVEIEKSFKIAGDENVHRGGHGHMEITALVVNTAIEEVGKNAVGV